MPPQGPHEVNLSASYSPMPRCEEVSESESVRHLAIYKRIVQLLDKYVSETFNDRTLKVVEFASPQDIVKALQQVCPQVDTRTRSPVNQDDLIQLCELALQYSVRTSSPLFFNQVR
jgi:hypothetical protein